MRLLRFSQITRARVVFALVLGCTLAGHGAASAQAPAGRLDVVDLPMQAIPWLVLPATWQGKPALMVYSRGEAPVPGSPGGQRLSVLALRPAGWAALGEWALPPGTRWVEPLRLPGGEAAWLMLVGADVQLGRVTPSGFSSAPLCACASLYAQADPEELGTRLARDLDGDGTDEVMLPTPRGLALYRLVRAGTNSAAPFALVPLGLALWQPDGATISAGKIPELVPWETKNGTRLVLLRSDALVTYRLPSGSPDKPVFVNSESRSRVPASLPQAARDALTKLADGQFADGTAFVLAFTQSADATAIAPSVPSILSALSESTEWPPERSLLQALGQRAEDRGYLIALGDLNGDGLPDLVHGLVRNESQILKSESELRFYPGSGQNPLAFGAPQVIKANGPAVAAVLPINAGTRVLLVARTEASFGALLRAMSSKQLSVEASTYLLAVNGLGTGPLRRTELTFKGFEEGAQVIVLTADLVGNGHPALLMNLRPDEISAYFSDSSGPNFDKPSGRLQGPLPRKREETLIGDFQGEGREAIIFWYRGRKHSEGQRRVLRALRWIPG